MFQVHLPHVFRQGSFKSRYYIVDCGYKRGVLIHVWPIPLPTSRRQVRQQLIQVNAHFLDSFVTKMNAGGKASFKAVENIEMIHIAIILFCSPIEEIKKQT